MAIRLSRVLKADRSLLVPESDMMAGTKVSAFFMAGVLFAVLRIFEVLPISRSIGPGSQSRSVTAS